MESQTINTLIEFVVGTFRGATPLVFAALAGISSERSGVVQIGLEGFMLTGALTAAIVTLSTGSPWFGFLSAGIVVALVCVLFAAFTVLLKTDQIVTGTAFNILAVGIAPFITKLLFDATGSTPSINMDHRFSWQPILIAVICGTIFYYYLNRTKLGLIHRFAGELPEAVTASGRSLLLVRLRSLLICGLFAGFGGATLSIFLSSNYSQNMTAGRGFIALAAVIFGAWRIGPAIAACLFFSLMDSIQMRMQGGSSFVPVQIIQILPYLLTIIAVAGFARGSQAPKGLGKL